VKHSLGILNLFRLGRLIIKHHNHNFGIREVVFCHNIYSSGLGACNILELGSYIRAGQQSLKVMTLHILKAVMALYSIFLLGGYSMNL